MDYQRALEIAVGGKAILFAGAGFSRGAETLNKEKFEDGFPTGSVLAQFLCQQADVPKTDDLKRASSLYLKKNPDSNHLIELLRKTFTVKDVSDAQRGVSAIPWKAIYTTNYDNVIERAAADKNKKLTPATLLDSPREYQDGRKFVLHINGYIDNLTSETLQSSFKLTNASYLTQQFRESPWCEVFIRDIQAAQVVFFAGYSLYDIDIQELIFAAPELKEKIFFIQKQGMTEDEISLSELSDFGTIVPIGIEQFSTDLNNVDPLAISSDKSLLLTGFEEIKFQNDKKHEVRDVDIFAMLLRGEIDRNLILEQILNADSNTYFSGRNAISVFTENLETNRNFMVIGDLGNGKTLLLRVISASLIKRGLRVFWVRDEAYDCYDEIEAILNLDTPVALVFDNYTRKMDLLAYANRKRNSKAIFLLSARTTLHRSHEEDLYYKTIRLDAQKTCEIDVNKMGDDDLNTLSDYFQRFGLWGDMAALHPDKKIRYFKKQCNSEMHGVLLSLLASPHIQQRFSSLFDEIKNSKQNSKTVIATFALSILNLTEPTMHMIAAITDDSSIFSPHFRNNPATKELFNSTRGIVTPKSSALAEFALQNFPNQTLLVDSLVAICHATRKKAVGVRFYWDLYRDMASFANVQRMLPEKGKRDLLIRFYEGLRGISLERENPLFWLQYAMARITYPDADNLVQAKAYLDTALALAKKKKNYTTTDIETQYARYHLAFANSIASTSDEAFDHFMKAHTYLFKITKTDVYKIEAFRPLRLYETVYKKFNSSFSSNQNIGLRKACEGILENIDKLPASTLREKTVQASIPGLKSMRMMLENRM